MEFVYHFKPKTLLGSKLLPLNTLIKSYPEVGAVHLEKYRQRRGILEQRIPTLDCFWSDAVHLSPINPQIIFSLWKKLGFQRPSGVISVLKIPANKLRESRTAVFWPRGKQPVVDFSRFSLESYQELKAVPDAQVADWHDQRTSGVPLFWYSSIMHVVTKDEIDVYSAETFDLI